MAPKGFEASLFVLVIIVTTTIFSARESMAQSSCTNEIITMSSCLNYVRGTSATPPSSCCSSLANVVQTNPRCLCAVIAGGPQLGVSVNSTLALSLPAVCKVQTPPVSRCNAANGPATSPEGSPEASPGPSASDDDTPDSSTTPSLTGSKATPGSPSASNGSVTKMHLKILGFVVVFVSSYVSKFSCI